MELETLEQIKSLINQSNAIFIAVDKDADVDTLASALSLYLSFSNVGKSVTVASPNPPTVELAHLVGINKLTDEFSSRKFIISLKDVIGRVGQVTYYTEGSELNLVVHTLPGAKPFSKDQLNFKESDPEVQLLILINVTNLENLGNLYVHDKEIYSKTPILSIQKDNQKLEGSYLEIGENSGSVSEVVSHLLSSLDLPFNSDIASNLYTGIITATNNFQKPNINDQTFEAAALCFRKRGQPVAPSSDEKQEKQPLKLQDENDKQDINEGETTPKKDWLQPKIYRSSKNLQ